MDRSEFTDADSIRVGYRRWASPSPAGVVLVLHGASEHGGRYGRFAGALVEAGWTTYAIDHRGHGLTAPATGRGVIGHRGLDGVLDDVHQLREIAESEHPGLPVVLFGHSMGSMIALGYLRRSGDGMAGCILSGTPGVVDGVAELVPALRQAVESGMGEMAIDALGPFNEPFEPSRTPYDWLSRDPAEIDAYVADPDCGDGLPLTYGFVSELMALTATISEAGGLASLPGGLPVLLLTGDRDPVSESASQVRALEGRLRASGHDVTARYYVGARHEVLNETNRAEVHADVIEWLRARVRGDGRTG